MPLQLADGTPVERGLLSLDKPAATYLFGGVAERPIPSINRGFSAPVRLVANVGDKDLRFLAMHDSDPFNRWQAVHTLAMRLLVDSTVAVRRGDPPLEDPDLVAAVTAVLTSCDLEPAFIAQVISLPSESDIAREIASNVDPDAIFTARQALRETIATSLSKVLAATYKRLAVPEPYSPDADAAGRRALKNACLDLITAGGEASSIMLAAGQYDGADNMTDRMAALQALSLCDVPERSAALKDFYARYASDPLIVDKWLSLQAAIPEGATLDRVKGLTVHPAFSMSNPNRVRALIGAFAMSNQTQSNRPDGAGYEFIVETVLAIDPKNPQLAARLLSALKSWRVLEPKRRALAQAALRRVAETPSLSRDLGDIVQRALAEG
jgi:aminopeptidase N